MEISELQAQVLEWARKDIGPDDQRRPHGVLVKMLGEVAELFECPDDPLEVADIFILMLDYCHLMGIDPVDSVLEKLDINNHRIWKADSRTGIISHVKKRD